ncbi:MAG: ABC transporter permease [Phycisphaerae bacterium]|nr:ABC transporter permease [Phycisphaerae bacterium]
MLAIAMRMLVGDRGKYLSLVAGLSFAVLLIAQQGAIFLGLIRMSTGILQNVAQADLWITDKHTKFIQEIRPLHDKDLDRVRSIPGIAWAVPFFQARALVDLPDGAFKTVQLYGIDRATLVGQPPTVIEGRLEDLRSPDAVMVEESSRAKLNVWKLGQVLKLNDRRAVVVGFIRAKLGFESNATLYATYDNAVRMVPVGRESLSFVLVKVKPGHDVARVAADITGRTGLGAYTHDQMQWRTIDFILRETGIGINFGVTVLLGFIVGLAIVTTTFYQFTLENLRYFAVLAAMGAGRATLTGMVLLQAGVVGLIGFGIGTGLASAFTISTRKPGAELAAYFPWPLFLITLAATMICVGLGSLLSLRRVVTLEPAMVFK